MTQAPVAAAITGLVLAGGRGQRMGGVDKGLQPFRGRPLAAHAIARLAPQVHEILVSANRNVDAYAALAARALVDDASDALESYPGPLAGILAGLRAARTPWLAVVPCDAPFLPLDLVARLARAAAGGTGAVVQRDHGGQGERDLRLEPVCCLLATSLSDDLAGYLASGRRKVEGWVAQHAVPVLFDRADDAAAFANFNTLDELGG
jgi:molybdopterin-guanine dinucleotide biosynthesis protein A